MKKVFFTSIVLLGFISNQLLAQADYFQQRVNYQIKVKLNDVKHELLAFETIEYTNNSPNALEFIYFHLWPNAYKDNSTAFAKQELENGSTWFHFSKPVERGFIDSLDFRVNGETVKWEYDKDNIDICKLILNVPLKSGEKIVITTPFHVKIPICFSRLGHTNQQYQISQWYPKPAVYDKYGWHQFPYLDMGEFYSEFGTFDVSITLPENYVVGATGNLMNEDERAWLDKKVEETKNKTSFDKKDMKFPESSPKLKTLNYHEENIHDFAWFADKRYNVYKGEVVLPKSGRKVTTWTMFTNDCADEWKNSISFVSDAVFYYSKWYGEYPYNNCTAVRGSLEAGGAMEYPTITVVGNIGNALMVENATMHEVGHNWFYGILGFNEREFPMLDEGLNSFSERRYMIVKYPDKKLYEIGLPEGIANVAGLKDVPFKKYYEMLYFVLARTNTDQPQKIHSTKLTSFNYGGVIYHKSALTYNYLLNYLGEDTFNKAMQTFFEQWKFKHPYPEDLKKCFEDVTGKNLSWYFDDILGTNKKIDYAISGVKNDEVTIKNKASLNTPFCISGIDKGNNVLFTNWYDGFEGKKEIKFNPENVSKLKIDYYEAIPEVNRKNNTIRTNGILRKVEPLNLKMVQLFDNPDRTQLGILPSMGWNNYNQFMLGAVFYNYIYVSKFSYQLMPMYGFGSNSLAGSGKLTYHIYPKGTIIQNIYLSLSGIQYAYESNSSSNFQRLRLQSDILFKKSYPRSPITNKLTLNGVYSSLVADSSGSGKDAMFYNLKYSFTNSTRLHPYSFNVNLQYNENFMKTWLVTDYHVPYDRSGRGLNLRFFAGSFIFSNANLLSNYEFKLSGTTGAEDYLYEDTYLGRFENIKGNGNELLSKQFVKDQGGFTTYAPYISTDKWMVSFTASTAIPKLPFNLYGTIATYDNAGDTKWSVVTNDNKIKTVQSKLLAYETGIEFNLNDVFIVYFPLVTSHDIKEISNCLTSNYGEKIRFTLRLNKLNFFEKLYDL